MAAILRAVGIKGAVAIVGWAAAGLLFLFLQIAQSRSETFEAQWKGEAQRAATAIAQVKKANDGLLEAQAINQRQASALQRQTESIRALSTEAHRPRCGCSCRASACDPTVCRRRAQEDQVFRERNDRPSAAEQLEALRRAMGRL